MSRQETVEVFTFLKSSCLTETPVTKGKGVREMTWDNKTFGFYRTQVSWSDLCVWSLKLSERRCVNLTDVTLTDEDINSILTDNTDRAIPGNVAMQVTQPCGQVCNLFKSNLTNASGANW